MLALSDAAIRNSTLKTPFHHGDTEDTEKGKTMFRYWRFLGFYRISVILGKQIELACSPLSVSPW